MEKRRKNSGSWGVGKKTINFGITPNQLSRPGAVWNLQDGNLWHPSADGQLYRQMLAVNQGSERGGEGEQLILMSQY